MAKPSIFSKDYEKRMKRRRLKIAGIIVLIAVVSLGLFYKFKLKDMDFNQIVYSLQAWVNSDNNAPANESQKPAETQKPQPEKEKPTEIEVKEENISFNLLDNEKVDFKVDVENGNKTFKGLVNEGYQYDISPNKTEAVILDKDQNMFLLNVDGAVKNITKQEYISKKGEKYPKDAMLKKEKDSGKDYLWGTDPKFIDDNTIVYKSNLPYFGASAKNQYLWIFNIQNNKSYAVFKTASPNIEILGINNTKSGINIKTGNEEYILDNEGKLFKG